jgi:hypothetical protein
MCVVLLLLLLLLYRLSYLNDDDEIMGCVENTVKFIHRCSRAVLLNCGAAAQYRTLASIILGPCLIKRIYRAAASQRLRTTVLEFLVPSLMFNTVSV